MPSQAPAPARPIRRRTKPRRAPSRSPAPPGDRLDRAGISAPNGDQSRAARRRIGPAATERPPDSPARPDDLRAEAPSAIQRPRMRLAPLAPRRSSRACRAARAHIGERRLRAALGRRGIDHLALRVEDAGMNRALVPPGNADRRARPDRRRWLSTIGALIVRCRMAVVAIAPPRSRRTRTGPQAAVARCGSPLTEHEHVLMGLAELARGLELLRRRGSAASRPRSTRIASL